MIEREIEGLVDLKTEDGYWDYKSEWHSNKAELLLDIICMANNLENRDGYLIIGVDDGNVCGVSNENRKNQQNLIDFLKDKKFAGGVRPIVYVKTMELYGKTIDVVIVKNTTNTPYYLTDDFQGIFKGNIYTRVIDVNTAKTDNADLSHVEYLWKKRFGIDLSALEKAKFLLKNPHDWKPMGTDGRYSTINYESRNIWYNKDYPEYTVSYEKDEGMFSRGEIKEFDHDLFWMKRLYRPFHNSFVYKVHVKYHSSILYSTHALFTDSYSFKRVWWKWGSLLDKFQDNYTRMLRYCYIEMDQMEYLLDTWLCNHYESDPQYEYMRFVDPIQTCYEHAYSGNPYKVVPVFKDSEEHLLFMNNIRGKAGELLSEVGHFNLIDSLYNGETALAFNPDWIEHLCKIGEVLVNWLTEWRNSTDI